MLASLLKRAAPGLRPNEHIEGRRPDRVRPRLQDGPRGIVSKRKTSTYRSGRSPDWIKQEPRRVRRCDGKRRKTGTGDLRLPHDLAQGDGPLAENGVHKDLSPLVGDPTDRLVVKNA
jgi:hypothetical protein